MGQNPGLSLHLLVVSCLCLFPAPKSLSILQAAAMPSSRGLSFFQRSVTSGEPRIRMWLCCLPARSLLGWARAPGWLGKGAPTPPWAGHHTCSWRLPAQLSVPCPRRTCALCGSGICLGTPCWLAGRLGLLGSPGPLPCGCLTQPSGCLSPLRPAWAAPSCCRCQLCTVLADLSPPGHSAFAPSSRFGAGCPRQPLPPCRRWPWERHPVPLAATCSGCSGLGGLWGAPHRQEARPKRSGLAEASCGPVSLSPGWLPGREVSSSSPPPTSERPSSF